MYRVKSPILFLVYRRLDTTQKVFEMIAQAKPERIYIAGDGPNTAKGGMKEMTNVASVREWILANINWPCEVFTLFREHNLGCKESISASLKWFFTNEQQGIILEDDCLPTESFFRFCDELLDRYRNVEEIMSISGHNYLGDVSQYYKESYHFSRYFHCWGWATWKRVVDVYDKEITAKGNGVRKDILRSFEGDWASVRYWNNIWRKLSRAEIDSWAYPMMFNILMRKGLSCIPSKNLVTNIGFGDDATHTKRNSKDMLDTESYEFIGDIIHPIDRHDNRKIDSMVAKFGYRISPYEILLQSFKSHLPFRKLIKKTGKKVRSGILFVLPSPSERT